MPKLPKPIVVALASKQTEFGLSEPSAGACAVFVTAVRDSPIQIMGRLSKDGHGA
jgi:hypothetical protein